MRACAWASLGRRRDESASAFSGISGLGGIGGNALPSSAAARCLVAHRASAIVG